MAVLYFQKASETISEHLFFKFQLFPLGYPPDPPSKYMLYTTAPSMSNPDFGILPPQLKFLYESLLNNYLADNQNSDIETL